MCSKSTDTSKVHMHLGNDGLSPYTPFINLTILGFDPKDFSMSGMIITESAPLAVFIARLFSFKENCQKFL